MTDVTDVTDTGGKVTSNPGDLAETIPCPFGCGVTFPDQTALDSHLSTYKHEDKA